MRNKLLLGLTMGFLATTAVMVGNSVVMAGDSEDELELGAPPKPKAIPQVKKISGAGEAGSGEEDGDEMPMFDESAEDAEGAGGKLEGKGKGKGKEEEEEEDDDDAGPHKLHEPISPTASLHADEPEDPEQSELELGAPPKPKVPDRRITEAQEQVRVLTESLERITRERDQALENVRQREESIRQKDEAILVVREEGKRHSEEARQHAERNEALQTQFDQLSQKSRWLSAYAINKLILPVSKLKRGDDAQGYDGDYWFEQLQTFGALGLTAVQVASGGQINGLPDGIGKFKVSKLVAQVQKYDPEAKEEPKPKAKGVEQQRLEQGPSLSSRSSKTITSSARGSERSARRDDSSSQQQQQSQSRGGSSSLVGEDGGLRRDVGRGDVGSSSRSSVPAKSRGESSSLVGEDSGLRRSARRDDSSSQQQQQSQSRGGSSSLAGEDGGLRRDVGRGDVGSSSRSSVQASKTPVQGSSRQSQRPVYTGGSSGQPDSSLLSGSGSGVGGGGLGASSSSASDLSAQSQQSQQSQRSMGRVMGRTVTQQLPK